MPSPPSETGAATLGPLGLHVARQWTTVLFIAVLSFALGIIVVVWPDKTLTVLSILLGIQLVVFGLFRLISAFSSEAASPGITGFVGVMGIIVGVIVLRNPFETVTVLAVLLGIAWIIIGAIDLIAAIADNTLSDRWLIALGGLLSIVAGVVVVSWPDISITVIAWVAGIYLVMFGIVLAIQALRLRSLAH